MKTENKSSDFFDVRSLLQEYASKWYLFVISVLICGGLAFLYTRVSKPVYGVRANILISNSDESPLSVFGSLGSMLGNNAYVDDEIFVISSHSVYKSVARKMGLEKEHYVRKGFLNSTFEYKDYPVELYAPAGIADTLTASLVFKIKVNDEGKVNVKAKAYSLSKQTIADIKDATFPVTLNTDYGQFILNKTDNFPVGESVKTTITLGSYDSAAEGLNEEVGSEIASRKSNVINMKYDTPYPDFGMQVLNEIVAEYNKRGIEEKNTQGEKTAEFIDSRLKLLASDLSVAESDIQRYKEKEGFVDLEAEAEYQTLRKGDVEGKLIKAETEAEILRMIRDFISKPENSQSLIPMTTDNEGLKSAIATYNELIIKRMDLANNALPNNTTLRLLDEQISAMRTNINISLDKAYDTQMIAVNELRNARKAADTKLGNMPEQEREFRDLMRQQAIKQELYVFLLQRREETSLMIANSIPKGTVIDEAFTLVDPLSMNHRFIWLIGIIIGLLIPPILLWLKDFFNDKFESVTALKKLTPVPILGEICSDKSGRHLVVRTHDTSSTSELFRLMRSNLQFILSDKDDKVVLVTSTNAGEGKSFISVNMAAALAMVEDKKVLLVGLDIRKPRVAAYLGINPAFGLTQYLASHDITLDQIITPYDEVENMDIIVAGPVPPNPAEMLQSKKLDEFFEEVRRRYDYIVVDTAPVGRVSDTFALNRIADATIFVSRANYTKKSDVDFINEIYEQHRLNKLSIVLNGTTTKKGYGYGYGEKGSSSHA